MSSWVRGALLTPYPRAARVQSPTATALPPVSGRCDALLRAGLRIPMR